MPSEPPLTRISCFDEWNRLDWRGSELLLHLKGLFASLDDREARGKRTGSVSPAVARELWLNYRQSKGVVTSDCWKAGQCCAFPWKGGRNRQGRSVDEEACGVEIVKQWKLIIALFMRIRGKSKDVRNVQKVVMGGVEGKQARMNEELHWKSHHWADTMQTQVTRQKPSPETMNISLSMDTAWPAECFQHLLLYLFSDFQHLQYFSSYFSEHLNKVTPERLQK